MRNTAILSLVCLIAAGCLMCACQPEMMPTQLVQVTTLSTTHAIPSSVEATKTPAIFPTSAAPTPAPLVPGQITAVALPTAQPGGLSEVPPMNDVPVPTPLNASMQALVDGAKADLAKHLTVTPTQVELESVSYVTWPDSSLGCPKPGMAYTQVTVDGLRIRLKAGGKTYEYHSGGVKPPFLCQ